MFSLNFLKHNKNHKNKVTARSREELLSTLKKTTLKSLKCIVIVNFCVLLFYVVASLLVAEENVVEEEQNFLKSLIDLLNIILFSLPIVFTGVCIWITQSIKKDDSVINLMKNISYARMCLKIFAFSKLIIFLFVLYSAVYETIIEATNLTSIKNTFYYTVLIICCTFISIVGITFMWIVYKLLYERSLKQLTKNYHTVKELL